MRIIIVGADGMIGTKLADRLLSLASLNGREISALALADISAPDVPDSPIDIWSVGADLRSEADRKKLLTFAPDLIFNLAAIVSGQAEANYELGMAVNVAATMDFLEDVRKLGTRPLVVGTSSIAVYGGALPEVVPDHFHLTPQSSYGTQKAIVEMLMNDHGRRGHFDARNVRLPTITVRPGKPNKAASSFVSGIIREPLNGQEAVLPVDSKTKVWIASPKCAVDTLLHAAALESGAVAMDATISGRGISVSVDEMLDALERLAGRETRALVREQHDAGIAAIVGSWPKALECKRAKELGFPIDESVDQIIAEYMQTIAS